MRSNAQKDAKLEKRLTKKMFFYISDIHVEHKIDFDSLPEVMPDCAFRKIVEKLVDKIFEATMPHSDDDYLLIAGDTCESIHIGKLFYGRLVQLWNPSHIIVVLGNHELWTADQQWTDEDEKIKPNLKAIITAWRKVFEELGIVFIQNETYEISSMNTLILGGIGFSGQNDYFNACNGMYLRVLTSRQQDRNQSKAFDKLYKETAKRCEEKGENLIVLTHNPWQDWHSGDVEQENLTIPVVYISGHTHKNQARRIDGAFGKKRFLADGQIGYPAPTLYGIKYFWEV